MTGSSFGGTVRRFWASELRTGENGFRDDFDTPDGEDIGG